MAPEYATYGNESTMNAFLLLDVNSDNDSKQVRFWQELHIR